jgi:hypothetical protein
MEAAWKLHGICLEAALKLLHRVILSPALGVVDTSATQEGVRTGDESADHDVDDWSLESRAY